MRSKTVIINEEQEKLLYESLGINNQMFKVADVMSKQIAFNSCFEIASDVSLLNDWLNDYDTTYSDSIDVDDAEYNYEIFYDERGSNGVLKGEYGNLVRLNWNFIESLFIEPEERLSSGNYDDAETYYEQLIEDVDESMFRSMYGYYIYTGIKPVILHELTHSLNSESNPMNRAWLMHDTNSCNEQDVRTILYLFSPDEMNSRVASAGAIMEDLLKWKSSGNEKKQGKQNLNQYFKQLLNEVLKNDELCIRDMKTYISLMLGEHCDSGYIQDCINNKKRPYSLIFSLAVNDEKLYKNSKYWRTMSLYAKNPTNFEEKVCHFYQNAFENYKSRIARACWNIFQNYDWNLSKEEEDEFE